MFIAAIIAVFLLLMTILTYWHMYRNKDYVPYYHVTDILIAAPITFLLVYFNVI